MKNTQINRDETKLIIITREDLTNGYKAQQSTHSVADFAVEFPSDFKEWKETSNSIIALGVKNESELDSLYEKLSKLTNVTKFYEPDINDELTSICLVGDSKIRKKLSYLPLLGKEPKTTFKDVIIDMINTPQTNTQNVLEHGISVNKYFNDLIGERKLHWRLPDWFISNENFILNNLHEYSIIQEYQIFHDMGKPYCLEIDSEGRRHFPNHAQVSYETHKKYLNNPIVSDLILKDMVFHTIKADEVEEFINSNDIKTVLTLLVTALCELHSNAAMFGGIESDSFKMKFKQLDRRGKQVLSLIKKESEVI